MARVLISMPERFLDEIDQLAGNENRTRSELIREALRTYMYRNQVRNTQKANRNAEILNALLSQVKIYQGKIMEHKDYIMSSLDEYFAILDREKQRRSERTAKSLIKYLQKFKKVVDIELQVNIQGQ